MQNYIDKKNCKTYKSKPKKVRDLINHALYILDKFGIPMDGSNRRLERMAIAFLACGKIRRIQDFKNSKDSSDNYSLKTRDIIKFVNSNFGENISSGSYDDIRRKDLKLLTTAGVILQSSPKSATNDSTRGYTVNPVFNKLIKQYGSPNWESNVAKALKKVKPLREVLARKRSIKKIKVKLPNGKKLNFSLGEHNELQKAIIEDFLPRYGYGAEILYVGDTSDKYLHLDTERLKKLNFPELKHDELPDIVAYSKEKNWIYLIEAVHSSGPIDELRLLQLQKMTKKSKAEIVYVTAFLDRNKFRKYSPEIAWETEVWIADNPDHMVHFNGDKFLGPYNF